MEMQIAELTPYYRRCVRVIGSSVHVELHELGMFSILLTALDQ
jgi:hypothetical protein